MITPHRSNRTMRKMQDGRRHRRLRASLDHGTLLRLDFSDNVGSLVRWEYYAENFLGFVQLACMVILLRQF